MPEDIMAGTVALIALVLLLYGPWQALWTDVARQILFERRDAIFDMARAGKLSFDSPEYRAIRDSFNLNIRFAHRLTFTYFVYHFLSYKLWASRKPSQLRQAVDAIEDEQVREEVRGHMRYALTVMARCMLIKSPLFLMIVLPVLALMKVLGSLVPSVGRLVVQAPRQVRDIIQREAETHGLDGTPA